MNTHPPARSGRQAPLAVTPPVVHIAPHAALLIDFDNVTLGIRSDLTKELRTLLGSEIIKGKVAVQRAYADWRRYPQYIVPLSESSIDLIFAPAFGTAKKNATDIRLAVDAIELVFTRPEIGTFILLSGDSDFSSLVIKLKEYGKYVIGVGIRESASDLLIQNCDEYYSYSDLAGLTREPDVPSTQRDPWELVVAAVEQMSRNKDVMRSDRLKQVMQQIDPNFDERNAGFSRFSKFVTECGNRGLIRVTKLENGQYDVGSAGGVAPAAKAPVAGRRGAPKAKVVEPEAPKPPVEEGRGGRSRRGRRGRGREREEGAPAAEQAAPEPKRHDGALTLAEAFQMLKKALGELRPPVGDDKVRARMVALLGREDPMLEPAQFGRLLRQANDAEVADVRKTGEDKYEVSPHRTQARAEAAQRREGAVEAAEAEQAGAEPGAPQPAEPPAAAASRVAAVRFRRGSRGGALRRAEIPLIGAVRMETEEPAKVVKAEKPAKPAKPPAKEGKPVPRRRSRAKPKAKEPPKG